MADLKPCPFCGGEAEVVLIPNRFIDNEYIVCCSSISCAIRPKTNRFRCEKKAIEAWNTRKPMEAVVAKLEEKRLTSQSARMESSIGMLGESVNYYSGEMGAFEDAISIVRGKE